MAHNIIFHLASYFKWLHILNDLIFHRTIRLHMASYGFTRLHMKSYGFTRLHAVSYCFILLHTTSCSFIWLHMGSYSFIMASYHMDSCETMKLAWYSSIRIHMASCSFNGQSKDQLWRMVSQCLKFPLRRNEAAKVLWNWYL